MVWDTDVIQLDVEVLHRADRRVCMHACSLMAEPPTKEILTYLVHRVQDTCYAGYGAETEVFDLGM